MDCNCKSSGKIPHWLSDITDVVDDDNKLKYLVIQDRNPMSIDNEYKGFKLGHLWLNSVTKEVFILVDFMKGRDVGIWRSISNEHIPVYTARDPLLDKDTSVRGFRPGTLWINSKTNEIFILLTVTDQQADWRSLTNLNKNKPKVDFVFKDINPTNLDKDYNLFTFWINTSNNSVHLLINNTEGIWIHLNNESIDGGTY